MNNSVNNVPTKIGENTVNAAGISKDNRSISNKNWNLPKPPMRSKTSSKFRMPGVDIGAVLETIFVTEPSIFCNYSGKHIAFHTFKQNIKAYD